MPTKLLQWQKEAAELKEHTEAELKLYASIIGSTKIRDYQPGNQQTGYHERERLQPTQHSCNNSL